MPNLQSWLNAWVKVNTKHPPDAGGSGRYSSHGEGISISKEGSRHQQQPPLQHQSQQQQQQQKQQQDTSVRTVTDSTQSTITNVSQQQDPNSPPLRTDPELMAIRKFKSRKHNKGRRLQRTNSFSDLIREKAKHRTGGSSSNRLSPPHQIMSSSPTNSNKESHQQQRILPGQHQPQHLYSSPPTSLHDKAAPPALSVMELMERASSIQSSSPTETVQTVRRSNLRRQSAPSIISETVAAPPSLSSNRENIQEEEEVERQQQIEELQEIEDSSQSALWGVAGFFGHDMSTSFLEHPLQRTKQLQRPQASSNKQALHSTQHGRGQEQPHYLRTHNRLPPPSPTASKTPRQRQFSSSSTSQPQHHHRKLITTTHNKHIEYSQQRRSPPHQQQQTLGITVGGVRLPFFTATSSSGGENKPNPFGGKQGCAGCKVAESELQHAQESLEYMRGMAIRKEYSCPKCGGSDITDGRNATRKSKMTSNVIKDASQQLIEVTARHKKQVEQLMKERNHWQRNMHLKLEKYANLCSNMNNESSQQSEKSQMMQEELEQARKERDEMAEELEKLRSDVRLYEKEREEHRQVQQVMRDYENEGLNRAEKAIAMRDEMIAKLSKRLETALDTLAWEREQLRQRRQIIFPPSLRNGKNQNGMNGSEHDPYNRHGNGNSHEHNGIHYQQNNNNDNEEEVRKLRQQLLEAQQKLESTQLEAKQRETALMFRCETLESQLNRATAASPEDRGDASPKADEKQQRETMKE